MPRRNRKNLADDVHALMNQSLDDARAPERDPKPPSTQSPEPGQSGPEVKLETIKIRIEHLVQLKRIADGAATDYAEAVKAVAESANCITGVVKRFVAARLGDKFTEKKREAEQLSLLFDEVGE